MKIFVLAFLLCFKLITSVGFSSVVSSYCFPSFFVARFVGVTAVMVPYEFT